MSSGNNDITLNLHIEEVEKYTNKSLRKALEVIGLKAESYAKEKCHVDTGLLRNSIAHAVSGRIPKIGKRERIYKSDTPDEDGKKHIGIYSKKVPNRKNDLRVYIGTNVYYAPYVEMGHKQNVGQYVKKLGKRLKVPYVKAQPFIRPALLDHIDEWKEILVTVASEAMKKELEHKHGTFTDEEDEDDENDEN